MKGFACDDIYDSKMFYLSLIYNKCRREECIIIYKYMRSPYILTCISLHYLWRAILTVINNNMHSGSQLFIHMLLILVIKFGQAIFTFSFILWLFHMKQAYQRQIYDTLNMTSCRNWLGHLKIYKHVYILFANSNHYIMTYWIINHHYISTTPTPS